MIFNPVQYVKLATTLIKACHEKAATPEAQEQRDADIRQGDRLTRWDRLFIIFLTFGLALVDGAIIEKKPLNLVPLLIVFIIITLLLATLSGLLLRALYFLSGQRLSREQVRTATNVYWLINLMVVVPVVLFEIGLLLGFHVQLPDIVLTITSLYCFHYLARYMLLRFGVPYLKTVIAFFAYPLGVAIVGMIGYAILSDRINDISSEMRDSVRQIYRAAREHQPDEVNAKVQQLCHQAAEKPEALEHIAYEFSQSALKLNEEKRLYEDGLLQFNVADQLIECLKSTHPDLYTGVLKTLHLGVYQSQALALSVLGRHSESKALYERVLNAPCPMLMDCDTAEQLSKLDDVAVEALHLNQIDEAITLYKKMEVLLSDASFTEKDRYQLYNGLANAYRRQGNFEEARRYVERAIASSPEKPSRMSMVLDTAAEIELDAKQYDKALVFNELSFGYELGDDSVVYRETMKARILHAMQRDKEACATLEPAIARAAKDPSHEDTQEVNVLYRELRCSGT